MGTVFKAVHEALSKVVAVKLLRADRSLDAHTLMRFEREAKAASSLSHPNLASVFDYGRTEAGAPYLVMDFLDGISLGDLIKRDKQVNLQEAVDIFKQIAGALDYAHQKGVVHRDLKPNNIVLMEDSSARFTVKLVDFGIAKLLPVEDAEVKPVTGAGEIFGSPLYMSPEQCMDQELDNRSDIYSFGCLMYETITGSAPFVGENPVQTMYMHVHAPAKPFRGSFSDAKLAAGLEAIVLKSLEKNPKDRYQSMSDVARELTMVAHGGQPQAPLIRFIDRILPKNKWLRATLGGLALFPISVIVLSEIVALSILVKPLAQMNAPWAKLTNRAYAEYNSGNLQSAKTLMKDAIAAFPTDNADVTQRASMFASLAKIYFEEGNLAQASKLYGEAAEVAEKANLNEVAESCQMCRARCAERLGLTKQAADYFAKVAALMTQRLGPKTPALLEPLASAGQRYFECGEYDSAETAYRQLIQVAVYNPDAERDLVANAYWYLACITAQSNHVKEAAGYYDQAAAIKTGLRGPDDHEVKQILRQKEMLEPVKAADRASPLKNQSR
jgi:serine/threonine protein kinase